MPDEMIIKTAEGNLVDEVYSSPVDEWQHRVRGLVVADCAGRRSS